MKIRVSTIERVVAVLFVVVSVGVATVMLTACGGASAGATTSVAEERPASPAEELPAQPAEEVPDVSVAVPEVEASVETDGAEDNVDAGVGMEEPIEESEPEEEEDPYEMLVCDEEFASTIGATGMAQCFLKRGERYYSLSGYIPGESARRWNIGKEFPIANMDAAELYGFPENNKAQVSFGDIPVLKLEPGDEVILYNSRNKNLVLNPAESAGYTFRHYEQLGHTYVSEGFDNWYEVPSDGVFGTGYDLRDSSGTILHGEDALEYMHHYTLAYTDGSTLHETEIVADSKRYRYGSERIVVAGQATSDGYATLDFSSVSTGLYHLVDGGFIEIP